MCINHVVEISEMEILRDAVGPVAFGCSGSVTVTTAVLGAKEAVVRPRSSRLTSHHRADVRFTIKTHTTRFAC